MDDPRTEFVKNINVDGSRVQFLLKNKIVLLCGGKCSPSVSNNTSRQSLRDALVHHDSVTFELFKPEEITEWQTDGVYSNLVHYEKDLAAICSLIVIIPESAGSIAELGVFSQINYLNENLRVILSSEHNRDSFIELGILRHLRALNSDMVAMYPIPAAPYASVLEFDDETVRDIIDDVANLLGAKKSEKFKPTNPSHVFPFIYQIVKTFKMLTESEIHQYTVDVGCGLDIKDLRSKLFLMQKFKVIKRITYGSKSYFLEFKEDCYHRMGFATLDGARFDLDRLYTDTIEYYGAVDPKRLRALTNGLEESV